MSIIELKKLIAAKLSIDIRIICAEQFNVRFHYHGNTYRVSIMDLSVEKVDGACLVTDSDARQLEKLLRGEQWDGTGLPPVGTQIEVKSPTYGWTKAEVTAITNNFLIAEYPDTVEFVCTHRTKEKDGTFTHHSDLFRPLRTERDKAIEQIRKVGSSLPASVPFAIEEAAGWIYDAIVAGKIDGLGKVG
nr:MAG TPA: hypothetical protein [Caudoviricetes sp.]